MNEIKYKDFTFEVSIYFGLEIIINKADGFINISKILETLNQERHNLNQPPKLMKQINSNKDYIEYTEYIKEILKLDKVFYQLNNLPNNLKGTFIHKYLLNYILMWADKKYALTVSKILDELNEGKYTSAIKEIKELREQNKILSDISITIQTNEDKNNTKIKLYKNRTQNIYKLSYNQDKYTRFNNLENYTLINTYVVLTASNILKSLGMKDLYDVSVKERLFSNKNLPRVLTYLSCCVKEVK